MDATSPPPQTSAENVWDIHQYLVEASSRINEVAQAHSAEFVTISAIPLSLLDAVLKSSEEAAEIMADAANRIAEHMGIVGSEDIMDEIINAIPVAEMPNRESGFVYMGNSTWHPKPLVNARQRQQRRMARRAEIGVIWTERPKFPKHQSTRKSLNP
jgi:hypothetical protein